MCFLPFSPGTFYVKDYYVCDFHAKRTVTDYPEGSVNSIKIQFSLLKWKAVTLNPTGFLLSRRSQFPNLNLASIKGSCTGWFCSPLPSFCTK